MQSSSPGIQVQFTVTIPAIAPHTLQFDADPVSGADRTVLGQGGFGRVYAGHYQGQSVAIKSLHVSTPKLTKALYEEAAVMFRLGSSYTVKLLGIYTGANETALVMERMTGGSLFHLLQDDTKELPWTLRYRLAYEIAEGLWLLHSQGILHRDLKSMNVLLDHEQHAKLTDFGFSKLRGQITSVAASSKHSLGTPAYKSPELVAQDLADSDSESDSDEEKQKEKVKSAKNPSPYSPFSDIYAYGVILWEIATRKIPFDGVSQRRIEKKIQSGKHEKIPANCPAEFAALINACWAMKPGQRPHADKLVVQMKALYEAAVATELAQKLKGSGGDGDEEKDDVFTAPWHIDPRTKQAATQLLKERALDKANPNTNKHVLLPANEKDLEIVVASYQKAPVPGYTLKNVKVMYNPLLNQSFDRALGLLSARHQNPIFAPAWRKEQGDVAEWRNTTHQILERMAAPYKDPSHPHLNLLPMWHATDAAILPSLFETGFATLGLVDAGYFGRGIYSAGEARYSYSVYGKMYEDKGKEAALLMNWVASYSAYPVIDADGTNREMQSLEGKGNHANHDAHFVPVRPMNPKNPKESIFFPCQPGQAYTYTELVVFDKAHCLPRYVVELQSDLVKTPQEIIDAKLKHQAEQAQKTQAKQQAEAAEKALLAQQAAEQAQKQAESLEKEREKERIRAEQIEAEKAAAVKQAVEAAKKEAEKNADQKALLQAKELQALKEKLAQAEAAAAKQKAAQEQAEKEAVKKQAQLAAELQKTQAEQQLPQALQAEKVQKEEAKQNKSSKYNPLLFATDVEEKDGYIDVYLQKGKLKSDPEYLQLLFSGYTVHLMSELSPQGGQKGKLYLDYSADRQVVSYYVLDASWNPRQGEIPLQELTQKGEDQPSFSNPVTLEDLTNIKERVLRVTNSRKHTSSSTPFNYRSFVSINRKSMTLLIGSTGAGKSTLINYLMGCKMQESRDFLGDIKLTMAEPGYAKMSHQKTSQALFPEFFAANGSDFYVDCPAFGETRGTEESICAAVSMHVAIKMARVKAALVVIDLKSFQIDRGTPIRHLVDALYRFIKNIDDADNQVKNSVTLVITKVPAGTKQKELSEYLLKQVSEIKGEKQAQLARLEHTLGSKLGLGFKKEPTDNQKEQLQEISSFLKMLYFIESKLPTLIVGDVFDQGGTRQEIEGFISKSKPILPSLFCLDVEHRYKFNEFLTKLVQENIDVIQQHNSLIQSNKGNKERIADLKKKIAVLQQKNTSLCSELKEIDTLESIKYTGEEINDKRGYLDVLGYSKIEVNYNDIPFTSAMKNFKNGSIYYIDENGKKIKGKAFCDPAKGIYKFTYESDYYVDGYLEWGVYIEKRKLRSNVLRIEAINSKLAENNLQIEKLKKTAEELEFIEAGEKEGVSLDERVRESQMIIKRHKIGLENVKQKLLERKSIITLIANICEVMGSLLLERSYADFFIGEYIELLSCESLVAKAQATQAQQASQAEKAEKESANQPQIEQVEKVKAEEAEKRRAAEEVKDDEDKTEGKVKTYSPLWQPAYGKFWKPKMQTPPQVAQFLRLVAEGEQDKAEAMLKANPNLILQSGTVTDLSKRTFEHITAFQYAVWARDWHMWTMLLKYLPEEEAALQLHSLETNGTEHGKQFDFGTLIGAYQTLDQQWKNWDVNQRNTHWVKQIGGAQLLVPAHVANEYSRSDRPFYPLPDFTQGGPPRERWGQERDWYAAGALGSSWSWVRGGLHLILLSPDYGLINTAAGRDAAAVQELVMTREQQLQQLKSNLYCNRQGLVAKVA